MALDDRAGEEFARGLTIYPVEDMQRIKGLKTEAIADRPGPLPLSRGDAP